jgi:ADP-ribosylglycohydrolase
VTGEGEATAYHPRPDQFSGCLIGQCLGDALGFPVEGRPRDVCQRYVVDALDPASPAPRGRAPFAFGQYTDDSQLARELMLSLAERAAFDAADYAARIDRAFRSGRIVGAGRATAQAAVRLGLGVPWTEAGTPAPSAGNGSAMRAAPVGLFFWDKQEERVRAAHDQGRITHADPRCSAGAAAIAGAVALALKPERIDAADFARRLADDVLELGESFAEHLRALPELVAVHPDAASPVIGRLGMDPALHQERNGISPFVVPSVIWSLYSFLRSPDSYWDAIRTAIAVGGDVDTTAAMTGAISGARLGLEALPLPLARQLADRDTWSFPMLVDLAQRCHRLAVGE